MRFVRAALKALSAAFIVIVVASVVFIFYSTGTVEHETREMRASFKVGASPFEFAPPGTDIVFVSFGECLSAVVRGGRLSILSPAAESRPLPDRAQLGRELAAYRGVTDNCVQMTVTLQGATPYRGSFIVHYKDGKVTKVDEPYFWD